MAFNQVLLVDDDEDDHEIFLAAIEKVDQAIRAITLKSAVEALGKLRDGNLKPDIIFLDLNMPVMNGIEFLTEIKRDASLRSIPVIILTTSSNANTIQQTRNYGGAEFLTKPPSLQELARQLQSILK